MIHHPDPPCPPWRTAFGASPRRQGDVAAGFACPFVFSVIGLLLDGVVSFSASDDPQSALLRFALVAGAPALAALAAMAIDGDATSS
jgi:hypothetical protein